MIKRLIKKIINHFPLLLFLMGFGGESMRRANVAAERRHEGKDERWWPRDAVLAGESVAVVLHVLLKRHRISAEEIDR